MAEKTTQSRITLTGPRLVSTGMPRNWSPRKGKKVHYFDGSTDEDPWIVQLGLTDGEETPVSGILQDLPLS